MLSLPIGFSYPYNDREYEQDIKLFLRMDGAINTSVNNVCRSHMSICHDGYAARPSPNLGSRADRESALVVSDAEPKFVLSLSEILRSATTKPIMIHMLGYHNVEMNTLLVINPMRLPSIALAR